MGFVVGQHPCQLRVYDKLTEVMWQQAKLVLLVANRWGFLPGISVAS
jgi:hypothetical protein